MFDSDCFTMLMVLRLRLKFLYVQRCLTNKDLQL